MNKTYYVTIILICLFIISTISSVDSFSTAKKKNKKKVKKEIHNNWETVEKQPRKEELRK